MTTLSQLVDFIAVGVGRASLTTTLAGYMNQTIRELHAAPDSRGVSRSVLFARNLIEDQLTANADVGFNWVAPTNFQKMMAVRFDSILDDNNKGAFAKSVSPTKIINTLSEYYYRSGPNVFFSGYGTTGSLISIAYFLFLGRLTYFPVGERPAEFDNFSGWTYFDLSGLPGHVDYTADNTLAETLVTNWMLKDWEDLIRTGTIAKYHTSIKDDRSKTGFSAFQQQRVQLLTTEEFLQDDF